METQIPFCFYFYEPDLHNTLWHEGGFEYI